jgi:hypothetical protein
MPSPNVPALHVHCALVALQVAAPDRHRRYVTVMLSNNPNAHKEAERQTCQFEARVVGLRWGAHLTGQRCRQQCCRQWRQCSR